MLGWQTHPLAVETTNISYIKVRRQQNNPQSDAEGGVTLGNEEGNSQLYQLPILRMDPVCLLSLALFVHDLKNFISFSY